MPNKFRFKSRNTTMSELRAGDIFFYGEANEFTDEQRDVITLPETAEVAIALNDVPEHLLAEYGEVKVVIISIEPNVG